MLCGLFPVQYEKVAFGLIFRTGAEAYDVLKCICCEGATSKDRKCLLYCICYALALFFLYNAVLGYCFKGCEIQFQTPGLDH